MLEKKVNGREYWWFFTPFLLVSMSLCYVSVFTSSEHVEELWHNITSTLFIAFYLSVILIVFFNSREYSSRLKMIQSLLVKQISLIYLFYVIIVIIQMIYINVPNIEDSIDEFVDSHWGLILVIMMSIAVKMNYLLKEKQISDNEVFEDHDHTDEKIGICRKKLEYLCDVKKIYLNPDLTKKKLSRESGIPMDELDYFLSQYLERDFYTCLAEYRIAHALELMDNEGVSYTLEAISLESGFNSRATFNKYFLSIIGQLPSDYLKLKHKIR